MKPTLFIIGDSTAASKLAEKRPEAGWGEYLGEYLAGFQIENHATNGRSTKSFIDEGRFAVVEAALQEGDYLLIQFGHNDQKVEDPTRFTEPFGTYQENLQKFVEATRKKGATPIILTSVTRRDFQDGQLNATTLGDYPRAALEAAEKLGVLSIDVFSLTQTHLQSLGEEASRQLYLQLEPGEHPNYPDGVIDNTHFNEHGAKTVAQIISKELTERISKNDSTIAIRHSRT